MNTVTPIQPDVITTSRTAVSLSIRCMNLNLFENATFIANLMDIDNNVIESQVITLTNQQYLAWNNNDEYIVDLISSILGVTPVTIVAPEVVHIPEIVPDAVSDVVHDVEA
jgi:hypothetical protein